MLRKTNENHSKIFPDPPKIMLLVALGCCCDVLGCLGSALVHLGVILGRSWDVLGRSCEQTWTQDGAQMVQVRLKMDILTPFGELCRRFWRVLGTIFAKIAKVEKLTIVRRFWYIFRM